MSYQSEVLADTPFVYWRMGGTATPVNDEGSAGVDATVGGGVTFGVPGPIADAIAFDGINAYVDVPSVDFSDTPLMTVELFVNSTYTNNNAPLLVHVPSWDSSPGSLIVNHNNATSGEEGTVSVAINNSGITRWTFPRAALTEGAFHHLVLRINRTANTLAVFVDGVSIATTVRSSAAVPGNFASSEFVMMTRSGLYTQGVLSEVAVYKSLLSDARIAAHLAAAIPEIPLLPYQSSGGLGGAIGASLDPDALFSSPTNAQRLAGLTDYRCLYLKNLGVDTLNDVRVWVKTASAETDAAEAIGEDTSNPAQTIAAPTTAPVGVSFTAPGNYAGGLTLGNLAQNASIPVWVRRIVNAGAAANAVTFTLEASWTGATGDALVTVSYEIVIPATFYVNADSGARSDAYTRAQAADDPTKPFATMQAAAMIAQRGDTVQVEPSTLGNANPADANDPDVYAGIVSNGASIILPAADNGGQDTITVTGHIVGGVRPKCLHLDFFQLDNWTFENLQKGYDRGSGFDYLTICALQNCTDLTFNNVTSTGGGWRCIAGNGRMRWYQCTTYAPFLNGNSNFTNGMGMNILGLNTSTGENTTGDWEFEDCWFEQVEGEDCIQCALGEPASADVAERGGTLKVIGCTFKDIILNPALANPPHTDCIQLLGVRDAKIWGNTFINVIQAVIASDHMNGRISMLGNVVDGTQNGMGVQGTQVAVFAHNTIKALFSGIAVGNRLQETIPSFETDLIIVNNVTSSIGIDGGTNVAAASLIENNVCYQSPGQVVHGVAQLGGIPEFGTSARLVAAGLVPGNVSDWGDPSGQLELSNSPVRSVGIGDGHSLSGLGLTSDEIAFLSSDVLGRAYATPRDVGALQSDPATLITPAPRPPYLISRFPLPEATGVPVAASVTATLYPVPGAQIAPATVNTGSAYVTDVVGVTIPAVVTLAALAGDGSQTLTVDLKSDLIPLTDGDLFPLVLYTAHLTGAIQDTGGSALIPSSWSFRAAGPVGPAIGTGTGEAGGTTTSLAEFYKLIPGIEPRFRYKISTAAYKLGSMMESGIPAAHAIASIEQRIDLLDALDLADQQANFESITSL